MDDMNMKEKKSGPDGVKTVYTYDKGGAEGTKEANSTAGRQDAGGEPKPGYTAEKPEGAPRVAYASSSEGPGGRKSGGWKKGLVIFLIIAIVVVIAGVSCERAVSGFLYPEDEETYIYDSDYIAELHLEGTITDGTSGDGYSQSWIMDRIEALTYDEFNKGIMLYIDSPGGSVYATSEVYKALKNYQEYTENPVYVYMGDMAASGGYYVAAGADRIYANENCWTGSIGVIVGTVYDFSELLDNLGIKAINITSGKNKGMGDSTQPLTDEQKAIYQGLVDDAFDRFVSVVAEGRDMTDDEVRKLADGRVYTAGQALENGLIDAVGDLDEAYADMSDEYDLADCDVHVMEYKEETTLLDALLGLSESLQSSKGEAGQYEKLFELMEENSTFTVTYLSEVRK